MTTAAQRLRLWLCCLLAASLLLSALPASNERASSDSHAAAVVSGSVAGSAILAAEANLHRTIERADHSSHLVPTSGQAWTAHVLGAHSLNPAALTLIGYIDATLGRAPPAFLRN